MFRSITDDSMRARGPQSSLSAPTHADVTKRDVLSFHKSVHADVTERLKRVGLCQGQIPL